MTVVGHINFVRNKVIQANEKAEFGVRQFRLFGTVWSKKSKERLYAKE